MSKKFYTADLHLDHEMIMSHASRPFSSVAEQIDTILSRFNERLDRGSTLYVLGDTCMRDCSVVDGFLGGLVTKSVHLILGNHDKKTKAGSLQRWATVSDLKEVSDGDDKVILCHYPFAVWNKKHHGSYHLHGHSHGSYTGEGRICDVGVDCWGFYPVTLDDVKARLTQNNA